MNRLINGLCAPLYSECLLLAGKIVLEALILTSAVVSSLTAYTFWASKKGKDFSFLGPVLFTGLVILVLTSFIQVRCIILAKRFSHICVCDILYIHHHMWYVLVLLNWLCSACVDFSGILPTWLYNCCHIWCNWCNYFLGLYCLRHAKFDQALHIWWVHLGCHYSLSGYSELVSFHSADAEAIGRLVVLLLTYIRVRSFCWKLVVLNDIQN